MIVRLLPETEYRIKAKDEPNERVARESELRPAAETQSIQIDAALNAVRRAQFGVTDILRRLLGDAIAAYGLGPSECQYQIIAF